MGVSLVAVVAEAPAARTHQGGQAAAATDAAGVERRPPALADGYGFTAGDDDIPACRRAGRLALAGIENNGAGRGVGGRNVFGDD